LKTAQKSLKNYCFACLEKALAAFIEKNKDAIVAMKIKMAVE
jgi:hypothetical protein